MEHRLKTLLGMFFGFFRIGAFTIGGGYAMLPLIEREFVERRKWVSTEEIVDIFALVQSVPGVIAINTSIFIGYRVAGFAGACIAALGVILPSFLILLAIAITLVGFQDDPLVQRAFTGVRAGVTALILLAGIRLGGAIIRGRFAATIAVLAFILIVVFDVHAILVIAAGAVAGLIARPLRKKPGRDRTA